MVLAVQEKNNGSFLIRLPSCLFKERYDMQVLLIASSVYDITRSYSRIFWLFCLFRGTPVSGGMLRTLQETW
jgi:hypothetical protein